MTDLRSRRVSALYLALPAVASLAANHEAASQPTETTHGSVVSVRPLTGSAALPSADRNMLVTYRSAATDGREVVVTGTIAIPRGKAPTGGWPLTTWAHGTTGIGPACAPSADTPTGPEHAFLGPKQALMDDYVRRGYAVVATDYRGLGGPGEAVHPFLQGVPAGRDVLDIMRAARAVEPSIGSRYVVVGHSQGGHADLFAASLGPDYVPELQLLGDVAMAPASHIGDTVKAMTLDASPSYALGYATYVLQSYASGHPGIDLSKMLTPEALAHLPETRTGCISKTVSEGYWATAIPKDQFLPGADISEVLKTASQNDPGALAIRAPTLVVQGTADDTVMPAWTDAVARSLCASGTVLDYRVYPGATHETIVGEASPAIRSWIDARFANVPATGDCGALPTAAPVR